MHYLAGAFSAWRSGPPPPDVPEAPPSAAPSSTTVTDVETTQQPPELPERGPVTTTESLDDEVLLSATCADAVSARFEARRTERTLRVDGHTTHAFALRDSRSSAAVLLGHGAAPSSASCAGGSEVSSEARAPASLCGRGAELRHLLNVMASSRAQRKPTVCLLTGGARACQ